VEIVLLIKNNRYKKYYLLPIGTNIIILYKNEEWCLLNNNMDLEQEYFMVENI